MSSVAEDIGYDETTELLRKLGDLAARFVVVGGQAVNFWAERYASRFAELAKDGPYTSKDIDLLGYTVDGKPCASALQGEFLKPDEFQSTPSAGIVKYVDDKKVQRGLDILSSLFGVDEREVRELSIPFKHQSTGVTFRVMHPIHCLVSRASNVIKLPGYDTPGGHRQLRASITNLRAFTTELLDQGRVKPALTLNERVFSFCLRGVGKMVFVKYNVDPFASVVWNHGALPEPFVRTRYPQMLGCLRKKRAKR